MNGFTYKRIQLEHEKLYGSTLTKSEENWIFSIEKENKTFKFYIDQNYPFAPPIKLYCNGKDMKQCSAGKYCYACHSIICQGNWSPALRLHHIIDDYITQLRESELKHLVTLVLRRMSKDNQLPWLPNELIEHICSFIF